MKKIIIGFLCTILFLGVLSPLHLQAAVKERAKCEMTIEQGKHTNENFANASGLCKDLEYGFYAPSAKVFHITGMANYQVTKNGQKFIIPVFSDEYTEAELTVYLKKLTPTTTPPKVLYKGKVTKSSTTVRNTNSTKGKKLGTLKKNTTVEVIESKNGWYKIKFSKNYGWVSTKDVAKISTTPKVLYKGKVTKSSTTVRNTNSTKGKKLGTLKKNTTVEVVESKNGWYKIKFSKNYGWVSTKDVAKISTTPKVLYKGKVTKSSTTVRNTNSTKGKKLGTLKKNATVEVVESKNGWYKIKYNKSYGWVSTKDIKKNTTTVKVLFKGKVIASSLNVRNTNSTKGKKIGTLKKNKAVEVVESKSGWYKIKFNKSYGWVSSKYIKKS